MIAFYYFPLTSYIAGSASVNKQWRRMIDNEGGVIHMFVFTVLIIDLPSNAFLVIDLPTSLKIKVLIKTPFTRYWIPMVTISI